MGDILASRSGQLLEYYYQERVFPSGFYRLILLNPLQISNSASYLVPAWLSVLLPRHNHVHHRVTQGGPQLHLPPEAGQHDSVACLGHCEAGLYIDVR